MQVRILGSSPDEPRSRHYASSYLVDSFLSIDAGTVGFAGTPQEQARVRHILLTHSHMDHIASLPVFLENAYDPAEPAVTLHALPETLDALREHVFNNVIWPDFFSLQMPGRPFVQLNPLQAGVELTLGHLRILPVPVHHIVPGLGFIVSDGRSTVVFSGDTGPTNDLWQRSASYPAPRSVFLECTFPDSMRGLADISAHLTPALFAAEAAKMPAVARLFAVHLKHRQRHELEDQLAALNLPNLEIAESELLYEL